MAKVICNMVCCKHRSKRPMRSYVKKSGEKCYGCMLDAIDISRIFDPDGEVEMVLGEKEMAQCLYYEPAETEAEPLVINTVQNGDDILLTVIRDNGDTVFQYEGDLELWKCADGKAYGIIYLDEEVQQ